MGSYKGVEIRELVGLYILSTLSKLSFKGGICLCKDDRLVIFKCRYSPQMEEIKKDIWAAFINVGLEVTIKTMNNVNSLNITFNLPNNTYFPFKTMQV